MTRAAPPVANPWSRADEARLVGWIVEGRAVPFIAAELGRSVAAVLQRRHELRADIDVARALAGAPVAAWPKVRAVPVPDVARAGPDLTARLAARIAALPRGKFWTPGRDLALAEAMATFAPVAPLAREWRCEADDLRDRWQLMCPDRSQAGVVGRLLALLAVRARAAGCVDA